MTSMRFKWQLVPASTCSKTRSTVSHGDLPVIRMRHGGLDPACWQLARAFGGWMAVRAESHAPYVVWPA